MSNFDEAWANLRNVHIADVTELRNGLNRALSENQTLRDEIADAVSELSDLKTRLSKYELPAPTPPPGPPPPPANHTYVKSGESLAGHYGPGQVVVFEDGVVTDGTHIDSAELRAAKSGNRIIGRGTGEHQTIITASGSCYIEGATFDHLNGAKSVVYAVRATQGSTLKLVNPAWTGNMAGLVHTQSNAPCGAVAILGEGCESVLGSARKGASDTYGWFLTSGSGPLTIRGTPTRPFKMASWTAFIGRQMLTPGSTLIEHAIFRVLHPRGRMLALRGSQPGGEFILRDVKLIGAQRQDWHPSAGAGAQFEYGGDTDTDGVDQTGAFLGMYGCVLDTIDIIQLNGTPLAGKKLADGSVRNFEIDGLAVANHIGSSVFDLKSNVIGQVKHKPNGIIRNVDAHGPDLKTILNYQTSGVQLVNCKVNGKLVTA